MTGIMKSWS